MIRIYGIFQIVRPLNLLITFLAVFIAGYFASGNFDIIKILITSASAALIAASGNIINDIFDIEVDKINRPDRALISGKLSIKLTKILFVLFNLLGLSLALFVSIENFLIAFTAATLIFFYSYKWKKILLVGNIVVSLVTGFAFIYGATASGNYEWGIIPFVYAFLINLIREIVKDVEDLEGDKISGVLTFSAVYGLRTTKTFILCLTLFLILSSNIPYLLDIYSVIYFIIIVILVIPVLLYFIFLIYDGALEKRPEYLSSLLKLGMVFGLAAIIFGSL
ncbi:MAG: geranylgeranylglycerol-phosphate geranylgeranyltransferase [Melioribacteraceae bacterium]|nr:geranylgeranylglycerol-phosphate geranylgeranyltransferase [Melioribacteraceae bacterium]